MFFLSQKEGKFAADYGKRCTLVYLSNKKLKKILKYQ
jgi:hypothetical protein